MNKALIFVFVVVIHSCCVLLAQTESLSARSSGTAAGSAPKKLLYNSLPSAARLYHLRAGLNNGLDDEDLVSEDEAMVQKRQYDDYGHMRFGKRGNPKDFDDYGHLRFGK